MPQQPDDLTTPEKAALAELGKPKARRSPRKNSFWCVGCIIDTATSNIRASSNCFEARDPAGTSVGWFDDYADLNEYCRRDSEILVLNQLDRQRKWSAGGGTRLLLVMLGEFGPCESCRAALKIYRKYHNLPATILYIQPFQPSGKKPPAWPEGTNYGWEDAEVTPRQFSVRRFP